MFRVGDGVGEGGGMDAATIYRVPFAGHDGQHDPQHGGRNRKGNAGRSNVTTRIVAFALGVLTALYLMRQLWRKLTRPVGGGYMFRSTIDPLVSDQCPSCPA